MKKVIAVLLALNTIFLSGCWDERELNELGLVMAVGIDKKKGGEYYTVTVQIAKPSSAAGQGGKSGGGEDAVWVGSAQGNTIFEAVRNIAKFSSRRIMWAHNNVIIIGQSLAEQDVTPVVDFFTRNHELRMKTWVGVAHGDARPYIEAKTGIENIPAFSIGELFRYNEFPSEGIATDMVEFFRDFKAEATQPLASAINMGKEKEAQSNQGKQIELEGAAVFKGPKLIGFLTPEETRGIAWLRKNINSSLIVVGGIGKEKINASVELRGIKIKQRAEVKGDTPTILIDFQAKGDINELDAPTTMNAQELKNAVQEEAAKQVIKEIKLGVDKVQKDYKSDVTRFAMMTHIADKNAWYSEIKNNWEDIYPQVPVKINASIDIESAATYEIPIKLEHKAGELINETENR